MPTKTSKLPRRKAKQQRAQQTVDALLEAAARVLKNRGYAAATTNRIAETAGTSVGTLYEYFADKDAVFDALIQREIKSLVGAIEGQRIDPNVPLATTLEGLLRAAMQAVRLGPDFIRALEQVPGSVFRRRLSAARRKVIAFARELLEAHRAELRISDLDLAAFIVVTTAEGVASNASDEMFDERLVEELSGLFNLYLTGSERPGG